MSGGTQGSHSKIIVNMPEGSTTDEVDFFETFKTSVESRTVGNNALRRFIRACDETSFARAESAIKGARAGGLRIDHDTYDEYLTLLLRCGQLKQALEAYNNMLAEKVCPHTKTFNSLMDLCVDRALPDSAERIFNEMLRRGRQPDVESYEVLMRAYAAEMPPRWEKAVAIFDKLQRTSKSTNATTYNALMVVYMNMTPFDWRVVYNCYYEMRYAKPKIMFGWDSYKLVDQALVKGHAGWWRRLVTFVDAWIMLTTLWTADFWFGIAVGVCFIGIIRILLGTVAHSAGGKVLKQKRAPGDVSMDGPSGLGASRDGGFSSSL